MYYLTFLLNRDFFFELEQINLTLYIYFVDALMTVVLTKNDLD